MPTARYQLQNETSCILDQSFTHYDRMQYHSFHFFDLFSITQQLSAGPIFAANSATSPAINGPQGTLLKWMIGDDPSKSGTPRLVWANFPESWGVFVLIAVVLAVAYGVFWLYRREINTCSPRIKFLLAALRLSVLLMLIAMYLKPSVFYQQVNETKPVINFLRDSSLSMGRGDIYRDPQQAQRLASISGLPIEQIAQAQIGRAEIFQQVIQRNPQWLEQIRERGSLKVIDFADGAELVATLPAIFDKNAQPIEQPSSGPPSTPVSPPDLASEDKSELAAESGLDAPSSRESKDGDVPFLSSVLPPFQSDGLGTDIWSALKSALDEPGRISSTILISDGQHNGSQDPLEWARKAGNLGKPIYVIGTGDPNPPQNIAVNEIYVRDRAYPDEPFEIEAVLQTTQAGELGLPSEITVQLQQQRIDPRTRQAAPPEVIQSKAVALPESGGRTRISFEHVINQPGSYIFSVLAPPLPEEFDTADNMKAAPEMEVVDQKIKVLLISGVPSWDYQHLQRLLQRDPSISLSCWLQTLDDTRPQEGNEPITRLPRSLEELGQYNIVFMLDPNPEEFDSQWIELLKDFCRNKAGGLFYMAGPHYTGEFVTMNRLAALRELLPVRFGDNEYVASIQALADARDAAAGQMIPVSHNLNHPVMSFRVDAAENQNIWSQMPNVYWSFPTLAAKPTARVLLERGDQANVDSNQPLLVTGRFGAGSVLYMGFRGAYRWRSVGLQAQYYDRFWIQVIRFLVETRSLQGSRRGFVDLDKTEFELGERINLFARVLDPQFQPSTAPEINALISSADGRTQQVPLQLLPQQPGRYEGSMVAQRLGNYQMTLDMGLDANEEIIDPVPFRIVTPSAEAGSNWLNEKLLREIAALSGGAYFRLEEIENIPQQLPVIVSRIEFNGPAEPLWDVNPFLRWTTLLIPFLLLTLEWSIRKYNKLL